MLGCWHGIKNPMRDASSLYRHELGKSGWNRKQPWVGNCLGIAKRAIPKPEALF